MEINTVYTSTLTVEADHNNDLEREMAFYKIAHDSVGHFVKNMSEKGLELFPKINYLPLMAKKVGHMEKVASRLKKQEVQQQRILEQRKKNLQKRFLKEIKKTKPQNPEIDENNNAQKKRPKHKKTTNDELDNLSSEDQVMDEEERRLKYQKNRFGKKNRPKDIQKRSKNRRSNKKR